MFFGCRGSISLICLLVLRNSQALDTQLTHIWQGFRHKWERRQYDFETPHRLGSFRNWLVDGVLSVEFTPGVNGDYAFPEAHFASTQLDSLQGQVSFTMEDELVDANNTARVWHSEIAPAGDLLLQGIAVEMKCVEPGICNSNAVWPTTFSVSLCSSGQAPCKVHFELARGYTPAHGGGKPLNTRMQYNVTLQWMRVVGAGTPVARRFSSNSSIHSEVVAKQASMNASAGILGFRGFGFQLVETKGHSDLGRYLEGLDFSISDWRFQEGQHSFAWSAGLWAPKSTTYNSDVKSWVDLMVLPAPRGQMPATTVANRVLNGTVCMDDKAFPKTFKCSKKKLPKQLSVDVAVPPTMSQLPSIVV